MEEENTYNCTDDGSLVQNWSSEAAKWCMLEDGESRMCSNDMNSDGNGAEDMVNHPSHYTWMKEKCGIEVIDITRHMDFNLGQVLKYILRLGHKEDNNFTYYEKILSDLHKAEYYLKKEIIKIDKLCKKNGNH